VLILILISVATALIGVLLLWADIVLSGYFGEECFLRILWKRFRPRK
jgi:hypothetical protein